LFPAFELSLGFSGRPFAVHCVIVFGPELDAESFRAPGLAATARATMPKIMITTLVVFIALLRCF
jgi:hypothetical protein